MTFTDKIMSRLGWQRVTASTADLFAIDQAQGIRLGMKQADRSLTKPYLDDTNNESYRCWSSNPLGRFVIDTYVNHIVGDCVMVTPTDANNEPLKEFLEEFWCENNMELLTVDICRNFELFGEVFLVPIVNNLNGMTKIGFIDPALVKDIKPNPKTFSEPYEVILTDFKAKPLKIIKEQPSNETNTQERYANVTQPLEGKLVGDVFYWYINRPIGATRGVGDLFPAIDQINALESLVWSAKNKLELQNNALLEIVFPSSWSQQKINNAFKKGSPEYINFPEESGKPFGHTENVKMNWLSPDIGASELEKIDTLIRALIEAGVKIPRHLWGQGDQANYATAKEMNSPFYRTMKARQMHFKMCLKQLVQFAIDQRLIFGLPNDPLKTVDNLDFYIVLPEIDTEDEQTKATSLQSKMTALMVAKEAGGITDEQFFIACQKEIRDAGIEMPMAEMKPQNQEPYGQSKDSNTQE